MTEPDDDVTDPEEFAEEAGIDPTPQEVAEYEELAKKNPPWSSPD
ncbi:hypothetical protein ACFVYA_36750 [Amycolatopsis sp. NPDC058278]|jgi:hypothetical protein|nr:hypothetical protein [Amycolatopsis sp. DG1A-15b]WIX90773.1 hypothetical protein QRY02_10205 [Amycolatopsis sp. DG1A-15b]